MTNSTYNTFSNTTMNPIYGIESIYIPPEDVWGDVRESMNPIYGIERVGLYTGGVIAWLLRESNIWN